MSIQQLLQIVPHAVASSLADVEYLLKGDNLNPRINNLLNSTVLLGGKRLRPMLTVLMGDFFGLPHDVITPYARDIERIHAATLAHDDVVDEADTRRGLPSINAMASNKKAILAGDYLLAHVLYEVASRGDNRVVQGLSEVIAELVEGEWLQIENLKKADLTRHDVELVALKKTGSVIRWCCAAPALISNASGEIVGLARAMGEKLGIAFQLGDDILDFTRTDGAACADLRTGVVSSVIFELGVLDTRYKGDGVVEIESEDLQEAIRIVRQRMESLIQEAKDHLHKIHESLDGKSSSGEGTYLAISALIDYLLVRV